MIPWRREPAAIIALVSAVIALVVAFGASLSAEQVGAIMAVVTIIAGLVTRSQVTPVADPRGTERLR